MTHGEIFAVVACKYSRSRRELMMSVYKHFHQVLALVFIHTWTTVQLLYLRIFPAYHQPSAFVRQLINYQSLSLLLSGKNYLFRVVLYSSLYTITVARKHNNSTEKLNNLTNN